MNDVTNAITTNSSQLTASLQSGSAQIFIENVVRPIIINGFKNVEQRVTTKVNSKLNAIRGTIEDKFDELLGKSNIELNIDLDLSVGDAPQNNLNPTHKTLNNPMLLGAGLGLLKGNPILVIAGVLIGKIISLSGKENSEDSKLQQKIHQDIIPNAIQSVTSSVKTQAMAFYENIKINFAGAFEELQKEKLENLEELKKEKESSELEIETKISNWQKAIDEIKMLME
jgi:hypothetical protein